MTNKPDSMNKYAKILMILAGLTAGFTGWIFAGGGNMKNDLNVLLEKAGNEYKQGDFAASEKSYFGVLKIGPDNASALYWLGKIAVLNNKADEAVIYYKKSMQKAPWYMKIWPLNAEVNYQLAMAYYRKDDFVNAEKSFNKAAGLIQAGPLKELKGLKALAKQMELFNDGKAYMIEGPKETRISFVMTDPLPVVKVSVNGNEPVNFFIDTGGAEIILDKQYAVQAGMRFSGSMSSQYAGQKETETGLGKIRTLTIGDFTIGDVPAYTLDVAAMSYIFGKTKVQGIIGTRLLMHFLPTIDYKNGALILKRIGSKDADVENTVKNIPFWLVDMHFIMAQGTVNNHGPMLLFVDTGLAGAGFTASETLLREYGISVDWTKAKDSMGGAGKVKGTEITVKRLTFGTGNNEIIENNVKGSAIEGGTPVVGDQLGFQVGGLISHQFFKKFAVTFDFQNMVIIIKKSK